jgi:ketosteroid isomerase-like protein
MSQENVEIVRRALDAFSRRELQTLEKQFCEEDFEFVSFFTAVDAEEATYRGSNAWRDYAAVMDEMWSDWRLEDIALFDAGDQGVVCRMRLVGAGKLSGVPVDRPVGLIYQLRDGKLWRVRSYANPSEALTAAGLSR